MNLNIAKEVSALRRLSSSDLRARYSELFGGQACVTNNRVWLIKRIAWRLQALAEGDLSERARQRALELGNDADIRLAPPRPKHAAKMPSPRPQRPAPQAVPNDERLPRPGTILTRVYKGEALQVKVLEHGLAFEGAVYPSLSAVAKAITGSHCNGFLFFRLGTNGGSR
jgi:hypothetical protein